MSTNLLSQTVTVDYGNRNGATPAIPVGLFSLAGTASALQDQNAITALNGAGLNRSRIYVSLAQVYATNTPNWSSIDWDMAIVQRNGMQVMVVIDDTPPSLQPPVNPCGGGNPINSPPTNVSNWAQLAASVVAHMDQLWPGLVSDYEIWNEPELVGSLCVTDDTQRLNTYISMFGAAALAMKNQAAADHTQIHTGGPVMSKMSMTSTWIPALLSNPSTAPYVDFVSFHLYITGQSDIDKGMTWSKLYSVTQASNTGLAYYYMNIYRLVRAGHQPNPASTPIYLSEYNDNWAFSKDCCRNDPAYGPLWNSLAIADFLNVVYTGANAVPGRLTYYASTAPPYFCILGQWNTNMDCNAGAFTPYPQFYAYQLFASPQYLDLRDGGNMAVSVNPASTTSGLSATAFYNATANNLVIINPTSTNYTSVPVTVKNFGFPWLTGTQYLLNQSNGQITSSALSFNAVTGGAGATISVPAYSTVALSMVTSNLGPPTAVLNATPASGKAPLLITADSSQSSGNGSIITGRTTDFGDGTWVSWQSAPTHSYTKPGVYTVTVTIKNALGLVAYATQLITVN